MTTKIYHLDEDPGIDFESEGFDWIVTDYHQGSWEGSGYAYGFRKDKLYSTDLGHCSCNGPETSWEEVDIKNFLSDNVNYESKGLNLELKVMELLRSPKMRANLTLDKDQIEDIVLKVLLEKFKLVEELELFYNEDNEEIQLTATVEVQ